jgi:hypothetical protein
MQTIGLVNEKYSEIAPYEIRGHNRWLPAGTEEN